MRGGEKLIVRHRAGQFTGELNMLSARRSLVRARAAEPSDVIAVDREALRRLVQTDPELSEILMRAFILRRVALVEGGSDALVLIGSRHSGDTLRIKEFLSRNGQPFQYEDVETDPSVEALLDRFHVGVNDVPIVVCQEGHVLKNPSTGALATALGLDAAARSGGRARRGDRRRRPGRARGRRLRRLRGAGRAGHRGDGPGRAGRNQLAHRELPRLPDRDFG